MKPQKSEEIAEDLRDQILSGDLKPGDRLPTHKSLIKTYRTTEITIRAALTQLELEQLIETRAKVGTFVRNQQRHRLSLEEGSLTEFRPTFPILNQRLLAKVAQDTGLPPSQTIDYAHVLPPSGVADRLGTGTDRVTQHHRVFYVGDDRVSVSNTYFPDAVVAGTVLAGPATEDVPVFDTLADRGIAVGYLIWDMFARSATPRECHEMRWPTALPVMVQLCTAYTADDQPVACWVIVLPGDRLLVTERCERVVRQKMRAAC